MPFRVTDASSKSTLSARINAQRSRLSVLQEQLTSGKRINRPSDDPSGAEAVFRLRTSQKEIEQFKRSAETANQKLTSADAGLQSYSLLLDRTRAIISQGLTDTTPQQAKNSLASELDALRERVLNIANSKYGDEYLFGGSRQDAPPFDPITAAPAATPASAQFIQIEPGTNAIAVGVTAESVFSDATSTIFADLTAAAAALRGTGDADADRTTLNNTANRLLTYNDQTNFAHAKIGANMKTAESASEHLNYDFLSFEERATSIEEVDFAQAATEFTESQRVLEATLQVGGRGTRSLLDFLS